MSRDWSKYNRELVKRGEILINPLTFGLKPEDKQTKKTGRPPVYHKPPNTPTPIHQIRPQTPLQTNTRTCSANIRSHGNENP